MNFMEGRIESSGGGLRFTDSRDASDGAALSLGIPDSMRASLEPFTGKKVNFGIRPEAIFDPELSDRPGERVKARVEVIEPMGSETYLYLTSGASPFVARVDPHTKAQIDADREFGFEVVKGHFFDPTTEKAIRAA
jgi:multiple sugar transport system ATP-binding protein